MPFLVITLQKKADTALYLTKNELKALKAFIFKVVRHLMGIRRVPAPLRGYQVDLHAVIEWELRDMNLHTSANGQKVMFGLKLDGQPFWGK